MEALRHSLAIPSLTTSFIILGCMHAMSEMVKVKYSAVDEHGKPLLPHPYQPWTATDPKYKEKTDKAFRCFKMFENVKEWTFLALPNMWIFAIFGGGLPLVTDPIMDGIILASGIAYMVGNHWYITGYMEAPKNRLKGFQVRRRVVEFWLLGSVVSVLWGTVTKFGIVP